jgi:hypothetical protein
MYRNIWKPHLTLLIVRSHLSLRFSLEIVPRNTAALCSPASYASHMMGEHNGCTNLSLNAF